MNTSATGILRSTILFFNHGSIPFLSCLTQSPLPVARHVEQCIDTSGRVGARQRIAKKFTIDLSC
jgi:hypothetical protein